MITDLRLQNFRSYNDQAFEFGGGVNIIVGPNGSGKTNLLEGLLMLCKGSSYRASDIDIVQHSKDWARLDGHENQILRSLKIKRDEQIASKEFIVGGTSFKRLSVAKSVPIVVFEPNHLQLLTQSPELRRSFLDDVIEHTEVEYSSIRRAYKRTLAQRNRLLKQDFTNDQMFLWDIRLSELGGQIAGYRSKFIAENKDSLAQIYIKLAGKKIDTDLRYESKIQSSNYGSVMMKELEKRTDIDRIRGFTTIGPHRDDMVPLIDGHSLASSASRGETRTMLLALKLLEVEVVEKSRGTKPILLLDDVFSELDGSRRQALTAHLQDHQTFITTTDADIVVAHFLNNCTVIPL